ncbi:acyltransferase family protein [Arthrobacter sp. JSM 101049]|uniref:acyltransferase family protein n=1 Tax=Arthrobacter sp. JSM 101049 TaxID=929097 RepID=UPI0035680D9B
MPTTKKQQPVAKPAAIRGFRPDIQGLRALAVTLVVVYHLWPHGLTGGFAGVDVFFVISGFLITSHLMKAPPRTGADFAAFWARRIRRLLPAAFVVLAATAVAVRILAPETQWKDAGWQIVSAAFYVQNWALAATSVDYLAADDAASPVQHFWSLSVEEQFYLLWPLIIGVAAWMAARRATELTKVVRWAILGVVVLSLAFSVYFTAANPGPAYFVTPTRMWELALGGLAAVIAAPTGFWGRRTTRAVLSWLGIAGIVWTGLSYTGSTPFPSYQALLPVAATALILWAKPESGLSPAPILGLRPVQYLGDISYSVYLWHWPIIALLPLASGSLGPLDKAAILVLSVVLAGVTKTLVEDKFRFTRIIKQVGAAYRFAAAGMVVLLVIGGAIVFESNLRADAAAESAAAAEANAGPCFGARAAAKGFSECPPDNAGPMIPEPALAKDDKSAAYADGCWSNQPFKDHPVCTYGDGPTKVALVGNSHAGHWLPALRKIAEEKGWTITTYLVSRCNPSDARQQFDTAAKAENCYRYGQWVLDQTAHGQFDRIITSERQSVPLLGKSWAETEKPAAEGYASYLKKWTAGGTPVTVIRDVPYPGNEISNIPDCLAENPDNQAACSGTPQEWKWMDPLARAGKEMDSPMVDVVDMERYFCIDGTCPAVIGGVVAYFDGSHITATYARTLAAPLGRELDTAAKQ